MPQRKSSKARVRRGVACTIRGCTNRIEALDLCHKHVVAELNEWFRHFIIARDECCQRCQAVSQLQCSHHITRSQHATAWDPENACAHCAGCHVYFTNHGALHVEWIISHIGRVAYEGLLDKAYGPFNEYTGRREGGNKPDYEALLIAARGDA